MHETLLHPFLYVIDFKRALSFDEAQASEDKSCSNAGSVCERTAPEAIPLNI
jgi:hypothetical protein